LSVSVEQPPLLSPIAGWHFKEIPADRDVLKNDRSVRVIPAIYLPGKDHIPGRHSEDSESNPRLPGFQYLAPEEVSNGCFGSNDDRQLTFDWGEGIPGAASRCQRMAREGMPATEVSREIR
jgi:hypothetical protein